MFKLLKRGWSWARVCTQYLHTVPVCKHDDQTDATFHHFNVWLATVSMKTISNQMRGSLADWLFEVYFLHALVRKRFLTKFICLLRGTFWRLTHEHRVEMFLKIPQFGIIIDGLHAKGAPKDFLRRGPLSLVRIEHPTNQVPIFCHRNKHEAVVFKNILPITLCRLIFPICTLPSCHMWIANSHALNQHEKKYFFWTKMYQKQQ